MGCYVGRTSLRRAGCYTSTIGTHTPAPELGDARRPTRRRRPEWLTGNVLVLCGVSFLQDAASELIYPVMPIFLTSVLGAPVSVVGFVEGLAEAVASGTKVLAGRIADRFSRRPLVGAGYGLAAVGKTVIAMATVWPLVLFGRTIDRFGKGVRGAPRDALLVEGVPLEARGRVFGLHRAADTGGAVVGPLIGLSGYEALHHHIRPLLVIAIVPAVLSVALVGAVRERPRPHQGAARPTATAGGPLPSSYWRVVTVVVIFSLANFPDALLLLRVKTLGFDLPGVILVYVVYNTAYAALSYPAGALSDRLSPARIYGVGLTCFAACYLGLGIIDDGRWVWPLLLVYGGFTAATDGVGKAWVSRLVPSDRQGNAQGWFQGLTGAAVLVAGVWAGVFWNDTGTTPLVVSGCVGTAVAALLLVRPAFVAS